MGFDRISAEVDYRNIKSKENVFVKIQRKRVKQNARM